jgi:hypothetical protein
LSRSSTRNAAIILASAGVASAMLTCGLAKTDYDKIGVAHSYWFRDRPP